MANNSSNPNELNLFVTAETSQAKKDFDTLTKEVSKFGKEFQKLGKSATAVSIEKEINKANNPLQKALSFLTKINKEVEKAKDKLDFSMATGKGIEGAATNLKQLQKRQQDIYTAVSSSLSGGALQKQRQQIEKQISESAKAIDNQKRLAAEAATMSKIIDTMQKASDAVLNKQLKSRRGYKLATPPTDFQATFIGAGTERTKEYTDSILAQNAALARAREALAAFELSLDPTKQKILETQHALEAARDRFIEFYAQGYQPGVKNAAKDIERLQKELKDLQENTKKATSWWGKLLGRIRNISIYRMIRSAMRWLTQGVSEGLNAFTQYSEGADKSLSNINNSLNQVRNTLAISFAYILEMLEPLIVSLSDMIVDVLNSINLALAKMRGDTYYDKVAKAADRMSQSVKKAQKFNFDAFNALSGGDNKTPIEDLFKPEKIEKDENNLSRFFERIIEFISKIGKLISDIVSELINSGSLQTMADVSMEIFDIIMKVVGVLTDVIAYLNKIGLLKPLLLGIAAAFVAIKVAAIGAAIASAAQYIMAHPLVGAAVSAAALAGFIGIAAKLKGYSNGGIPAKSEIFYMNENGRPEALVNTGGSQTNVINIAQLTEGIRQGFIQAIYDTGLNFAGGGQSILQVDKNVLGRAVAESSGFRNEVNRRNPALKLR